MSSRLRKRQATVVSKKEVVEPEPEADTKDADGDTVMKHEDGQSSSDEGSGPDYEEVRLENIRKNQALLAELNIPTLVSETRLPVISKPRTDKKRKQRDFKTEPSGPVRRSLRNKGVDASGVSLNEAKLLEAARIEAQNQRPPRPVGILPLHPATEMDDVSHVRFLSLLQSIKPTKIKQPTSGKFGPMLLREESVKVVPQRIYSICCLHAPDQIIVATGDKSGHIGFLVVKEDQKIDDEEDRVFSYKPHVGPVSELLTGPHTVDKLFSSCYDGSVRVMDITEEKFDEVYVDEDEEGLTGLCLDRSAASAGNIMFAACRTGAVTVIDRRAPMDEYSSYALHERKVSCVDCHPITGRELATACNDGTVCVWDVRMLKNSKNFLHRLPHTRAVNSAFYSPSGQRLLSLSYDNLLRMWVNPDESASSANWGAIDPVRIKHDNNTGRWITPFKARWGVNDEQFVVGNMQRALDVFELKPAGAGSKAPAAPLLNSRVHEYLTSIPAVNAFHPFQPVIASGTASGKIYTWLSRK